MSVQAVAQPEPPKAKQRQQPERLGSRVSTKQMAQAAAHGRKVSFPTLGLDGYLVGMDDFHWLIAQVTYHINDNTSDVEVALVHKSAPLVRFSKKGDLASEPDEVQREINEIGGGFFAFCRRQPGAPDPS